MLAKAAAKPAYVVLNAVPPRSAMGKEAADGLSQRGVRVAPCSLTQRAAFAHGVIDGRTAQEFEPNGKAAQEIDQIYRWLCGLVDMPTRKHVRKAGIATCPNVRACSPLSLNRKRQLMSSQRPLLS